MTKSNCLCARIIFFCNFHPPSFHSYDPMWSYPTLTHFLLILEHYLSPRDSLPHYSLPRYIAPSKKVDLESRKYIFFCHWTNIYPIFKGTCICLVEGKAKSTPKPILAIYGKQKNITCHLFTPLFPCLDQYWGNNGTYEIHMSS